MAPRVVVHSSLAFGVPRLDVVRTMSSPQKNGPAATTWASLEWL